MDIISTYIAEPFMAGLFNVVLDRLVPENTSDISTDDNDLLKLRISMKKVKEMIEDAEEKKDMSKLNVKDWVNELKHTVYDAEDLIDEIRFEALQKKNNYEIVPHQIIDLDKVISNIIDTLNRFANESSDDPPHQGKGSRIQVISGRLEILETDFKQQRDILPSPRPSTSLVDESKTSYYGRDSEKETIIQILCESDELGDDSEQGSLMKGKELSVRGIHIIAIVGMPGIGKTSLAQLVYRDERVTGTFPFQSWNFDTGLESSEVILTSILEELSNKFQSSGSTYTPSFYQMKNLEKIQQALRRKMNKVRVLIVFDGVRDEESMNNGKWNTILDTLKAVAPAGSAIIITTCDQGFAERINPTCIIQLQELPNDDGLTLFKEHASAAQDDKLEAIAKIITAKCKGLPLAIKVIASLLHSTPHDEWESIANSKMWELPNKLKEEIRPALLLGYKNLPQHLRRCFAYCSIFPKNYYYEKEKLVLLWMAEGFLEEPNNNDCGRIEKIGDKYFKTLQERSFFQATSKHYYVMHDLIHDLASYAMGELGFTLKSFDDVVMSSPRHFSFQRRKYDTTAENFGLTLACANHLRTFLPSVTSSSQSCYYLSHKSLQLLGKFFRLRVLSLNGYQINSIPSSIGRLKHLRYLDFSSTLIKVLPESICDLLNLQTLLLSYCKQLTTLPTAIRNLVHLRHLDIRGTCKLKEMPEQIGTLSSLQTLTDFVVGEDYGISIRELGGISQLRGSLRISGIENVVAEVDALGAKLSDMKHLDELVLVQQEESYDDDRQHELLLLSLKPHTNLRKLTIHFYEGDRFPYWVGDEAFRNLDTLHLEKCPHCVHLPSLGQLPSLKHLSIKDFDQLKELRPEFFGQNNRASFSPPFKLLLSLKFQGLNQWQEWLFYEDGAEPLFPSLQELRLLDCRQLMGKLPSRLPSLAILEIKNCQKLDRSLPNSSPLRELSLDDFASNDLQKFTQLTNLSLTWARQVESDTITNSLEAIRKMTALKRLLISSQQDVLMGEWHLPSSIKSLSASIATNKSTTDPVVRGCSQLQYMQLQGFPSPQLSQGHYSTSLESLSIFSCSGLTELPSIRLTSLYDLYLVDCVRLGPIPSQRLFAPELVCLTLHGCSILTTLPNGMYDNLQSLRFLSIQICPVFEKLSEDPFPPGLRTLCIGSCQEFRMFPEKMSSCRSLEFLDIQNCSTIASFPASGLPPNLQRLHILNCNNLTSLPEKPCHNLKLLVIWKCPKIESFPQVGLPPSLESLELDVTGCEERIQSNVEWQLGRLICLKELRIKGIVDVESFPADDSMPINLNVLKIEHFSKLKLINCRELQRISNLREFQIERCPALVSFSDNLPQSLCHLSIQRSTSMVKRCRVPDRESARWISHITCLELD